MVSSCMQDGLECVFSPDIIPSGWQGWKHQLTHSSCKLFANVLLPYFLPGGCIRASATSPQRRWNTAPESRWLPSGPWRLCALQRTHWIWGNPRTELTNTKIMIVLSWAGAALFMFHWILMVCLLLLSVLWIYSYGGEWDENVDIRVGLVSWESTWECVGKQVMFDVVNVWEVCVVHQKLG